MIDQATVDRAVSVLLEFAEGDPSGNEGERLRAEAALGVLSAAQFGPMLGDDPAAMADAEAAVDDLQIRAFRAGARWRKANPERRLSERQILEQLADAATG